MFEITEFKIARFNCIFESYIFGYDCHMQHVNDMTWVHLHMHNLARKDVSKLKV